MPVTCQSLSPLSAKRMVPYQMLCTVINLAFPTLANECIFNRSIHGAKSALNLADWQPFFGLGFYVLRPVISKQQGRLVQILFPSLSISPFSANVLCIQCTYLHISDKIFFRNPQKEGELGPLSEAFFLLYFSLAKFGASARVKVTAACLVRSIFIAGAKVVFAPLCPRFLHGK